MSEVQETSEGAATEAPAGASPTATAAAVALGRASRAGKAIDAKAASFLDEQTLLTRLQAEHLHEQRELTLSRLRLGRWKDRVSLSLQAITALVGLAIVGAIAVMAWQAREDHGLVIDAFSVPPELAQGGLTGQVAAARFLDKLQAMQTASVDSDRPAQSYQNNWGADFKVDIPETGVSFGEFEKLLRDKLGHVSHVTGEVLKTPAGIALTARIGDAPPQTFTGPSESFDALAQQAAEAVYRASQPYRFAEYLDGRGRAQEAFSVVADLAANGPESERGWAYALWAVMDLNDHGDIVSARRHAAQGLGLGPGSDIEDRIGTVGAAVWSGHEETNLQVSRIIQVEAQKRQPDTSPLFFSDTRLLATAWLQFILPDYRASASTWTKTAGEGKSKWTVSALSMAMAATAWAMDHDPASARVAMARAGVQDETTLMPWIANGAFPALPVYWIAVEDGDWPAALADAKHVDGWLETAKSQRPIYALMQQVWIWPLEALALARTGDVAAADLLIQRTPPDCYLCLRVRGQIAAVAHNWPLAERWFAEAVRQAPSSPFAYSDWGRMRLDRGDVAGAIAKLELSREKGPHFADPLELWGEALMRTGDFDGAVATFARADKDAPRWGLNHLRWGQALARLGRTDEARAQRRAAAGMGLSTADRAELTRMQAHD